MGMEFVDTSAVAHDRGVTSALDETIDVRDSGDSSDGALPSGVPRGQIEDEYFDTRDLRLARWGWTLRHRDGQGWTVGKPRDEDGSGVCRDEVVLPGPSSRPPADVLALVAPLTRGAEVGPVTRLPIDGVGQEGAPWPNLLQALGDTATAPPDVTVPELSERPKATEVIQLAFAASVIRVLLHLPSARIGTDPEGVHQARVGTRRLRSDLQTFEPLLDAEWAAEIRTELRWLADELGRVRDDDVLAMKLRAVGAHHSEIDSHSVDSVLAVLEEQRDRDRARLLGHLADDRALELFDHLVRVARTPHTRGRAARPARTVMPKLVRKRWTRLRKAVDALPTEPAPADLHTIRILAKRVRYAAEAVAPAAGKKATKFANAAAEIQDALGELNDAAVARHWLADAVQFLDKPGAFAAGQLAQQLESDARPNQRAWSDAYGQMERHSGWLS